MSLKVQIHMSGMIADDLKNLEHVGKIETLSIFLIRPQPSQNYRGCLRFMVFISRQNRGCLGNCEIPNRLRFSRHMKARLKCCAYM